ncbi:hypothetical protein H8E77_26885 [bacterium]|nr:hypothetical protein [bacterium]
MNETQHIPYSDKIRQLIRKKSGVLFSAHRRKDDGLFEEANALFNEAAEQEVQIAHFLEASGQRENALISWVSAASCYMNAGDFSRAGKLFEFILTKNIRPRLRRDVKKFKKRCETENKKKPKIRRVG